MYMLEKIINGRPQHSLYGESKLKALEAASMMLWFWFRFIFKDRCDPEAAKKVMVLKDQEQHAAAMDVWNEANTNPTIWLHEVEIFARHCHHDEDTLAREDEYYAVEIALDGGCVDIELLPTNFAALEYAAGLLRDWTSRNPLYAFKCDGPTRHQVRQLLRKNKVADAIDAWMAGKPNQTIAIHKLRVLRKRCHHDEPGNDLSSQYGNCCRSSGT
jgi:hypothetical protein